MNWFPFAILTTSSWVLYHTASRLTGGKVPPLLGSAIAGLTALTVGLIAYLILPKSADVAITRPGILFAALMGMGTVLGDVFYIYTYQKNAPLSTVGPLMLVAVAVITTLLGFFVFKESLSWYKMGGVALGIVSLYLLTK